MVATSGGYNIDDYLIPIDSTLRLYNVPGITVSTTALSIDPNTTTVYTAWIFVEGF